ncbi:MAG: manganese efflux pump [Paludibacteraceae bacterium]
MDLFSIIIIGIGLAMDCFAVSITQGICSVKLKIQPALKMAFLFGLFQGMMPLIGFFAGQVFAREMKNIDHWVAFGILLFIGGKMIYESFKTTNHDEENCICDPNRLNFPD